MERRNLGLELVRATEAAALAAGRWMGLGLRDKPDEAASKAMVEVLNTFDMQGHIVIGEEGKLNRDSPLASGKPIGTGDGPEMDVVVDAIDGRTLLATGKGGAVSVAAIARGGCMWSPEGAAYMDKIVVNEEAAHVLVPECLDAPAAWTLALIARAKKKNVRDLVVFMLERPRHRHLIQEIRTAGARIMLSTDGDVAGALLAALPQGRVDVLMGIGGVSEGVMAACAIRAIGGAMIGRLAPQGKDERDAIEEAGLDIKRILTAEELVTTTNLYFAITGITDGLLLSGVSYRGEWAETHSLILRGKTGRRRTVQTDHHLEEELK